MAALNIGDPAPDFSLTALLGGLRKLFRLSEHRERNVVALFHSLNWTPTSEQFIRRFNQYSETIHACNAEMIAISVDSVFNTMAWEKAIGPVQFSLGSDYWPHGAAAKSFGVFREQGEEAGVAENSAFVVDQSGRIAFARVCRPGDIPDPDEVTTALRKLHVDGEMETS
jgi:peroxiredoxin (alkyl hydroperoxide reductase subunit C)